MFFNRLPASGYFAESSASTVRTLPRWHACPHATEACPSKHRAQSDNQSYAIDTSLNPQEKPQTKQTVKVGSTFALLLSQMEETYMGTA